MLSRKNGIMISTSRGDMTTPWSTELLQTVAGNRQLAPLEVGEDDSKLEPKNSRNIQLI